MILRHLQDDRSLTIERGDRPTFSADSRYLVAHVEPMEEAVDAAREGGDAERNGDFGRRHFEFLRRPQPNDLRGDTEPGG